MSELCQQQKLRVQAAQNGTTANSGGGQGIQQFWADALKAFSSSNGRLDIA
jgi:hypothetical protein